MNIHCFRLDLGVLGTILLLCAPVATAEAGAVRELCSPDGKIAITVYTNAPLGYSVTVDSNRGDLLAREIGRIWR